MKANRVIMLALVGALSLAACSSDSKAGGSSTTLATSATSATSAATTIKVSSTTARGDVLVDGTGRTLYLFEKDSGTTSACTGGCVANWPPLSGTVTASTGVDASKLGSAHGQVTYNGHLLYYFSGDSAPGDMKGVDIEEWYPVTPDGGSAEAK
jgi:predicted lipoprotein with Yx(FWY)xxD motif